MPKSKLTRIGVIVGFLFLSSVSILKYTQKYMSKSVSRFSGLDLIGGRGSLQKKNIDLLLYCETNVKKQ
jgi:hypothetical protein